MGSFVVSDAGPAQIGRDASTAQDRLSDDPASLSMTGGLEVPVILSGVIFVPIAF